jgi:hypothetical protein
VRLVIELDNKWLSIEIGDIEPEEDSSDDSVSTAEAERVSLPVGFQLPPNRLDDDNAPETEETDDDEEWEDDEEAAQAHA